MAKGGPDGGDGGQRRRRVAGGRPQRGVAATASGTIPHRRAGNGTHGMGKGRHGQAGADLEVPGARGHGRAGCHAARCWPTWSSEGDRWLAARGGQGGRGNARFLSNRRRAPAFAEQAELGEERWLDLELKLMADVALVGFPNAGQEHAHLADLGGQAQDRRLPVHHPRAAPGRGPLRRARVRGGRHPRPDRRGERRPGPRSPVPPPHRTGPGAGGPARPGRARRTRSPADQERILLEELRRLPARAGRPAPAGRRFEGRLPPPQTWIGRGSASRRSPVRACARCSAAWPPWSPRPGPRSPRPRPLRGAPARAGRDRGRARRRRQLAWCWVEPRCGPWPCRISPTPTRWPTPRGGCAASGSTGPWPGPAPGSASGSTSATSSSTTSPTTDVAG